MEYEGTPVPVKKKHGRPRSMVWEQFWPVQVNGKPMYQCKNCLDYKKSKASSSTVNLSNHIINTCPKVNENLKRLLLEKSMSSHLHKRRRRLNATGPFPVRENSPSTPSTSTGSGAAPADAFVGGDANYGMNQNQPHRRERGLISLAETLGTLDAELVQLLQRKEDEIQRKNEEIKQKQLDWKETQARLMDSTDESEKIFWRGMIEKLMNQQYLLMEERKIILQERNAFY